jgi:hypothetical protein
MFGCHCTALVRVYIAHLAVLATVVSLAGCGSGDDAKSGAASKINWTQSLHKKLDGVTRLRVRSGGTCHRTQENEKTLSEVTDADQIADFVNGIEINDSESGFQCMCCGNPSFEFYRGDKLVLTLGFHHGRSLRWPDGDWPADGLLTERSAAFLIKWLDDHGVDGPKKDQAERISRERLAQQSEDRWRKAMPASLRPYWNQMQGPVRSDADIRAMDAALVREYPNREKRIFALLEWYGSGEGPWSGFPGYESIPEDLLLRYSTKDILRAIKNANLTTQQIEGAARFFGGWEFSQSRSQDMQLLSTGLKKKLLQHSLESKDEDKKARARTTFGDK